MVVFPDKTRKIISYPKYLMEVHLGRYLAENETIDHIDGNFLNNDLSNLQVIDRRKHSYNDVYRNEDVTVNCQYCGKEFIIKGSTIARRNRRDRHQSGYFCSRQCSGKYGKGIQRGIIEHTTVDRVVPNRYQVKSAKDENL